MAKRLTKAARGGPGARQRGGAQPVDAGVLPPHFDRVYLLRSVERTLIEEIDRKPTVETGGVLVGFVDPKLNAAVVTAASGPGPKAVHGRTHFNRDREFCQDFLNRHAAATGGVIDFIGEWHKHPEPNPRPSSTDAATYRALTNDPAAATPRAVVLIVGTQPSAGRWPRDAYVRTNAFVFRPDGWQARRIEWRSDEAYADLGRPSPSAGPHGPADPTLS